MATSLTLSGGDGRDLSFKSRMDEVTENEVKILVDRNIATSPKKAEVFYNKDMVLNRMITLCALAAYKEEGLSVFQPIRCLDAIGATGVTGLLWQKHVGGNIDVTINDPHEKAFERIHKNIQENGLRCKILNKDVCLLLHEEVFNFIFLNCYGSSVNYLDAAFRNLPKNGILIITSTDDASLYGKAPEATFRNYGGHLVKTSYVKELAVRLILEAVIRSAAKCNKGIKVLCSVAVKGVFTIVVQVIRGPASANECLKKIRKVIHCSVCEDRAFYPYTVYPVENPYSMLSCDCHGRLPGKSAIELGPVWSGEIFSASFIAQMLSQAKKWPWAGRIVQLLETIFSEVQCTHITSGLCSEDLPVLTSQAISTEDEYEGTVIKRPRLDKNSFSHKDIKESVCNLRDMNFHTPPFYYNLHRHSPKGKDLLRIKQAILCLQQAGFRASRSHFDPEAVRTDATLQELYKMLENCSSQTKTG